MKRPIKIISYIILSSFLLLFKARDVFAAGEIVGSETLIHECTGSKSKGGGCYTQEVKHNHTNGCYTTVSGTCSVSTITTGTSTWSCYNCGKSSTSTWYKDTCSCGSTSTYGKMTCSSCGKSSGSGGGISPHSISNTKLNCNKTIEYYNKACGTENGEMVGAWELSSSSTEWAKEITLTASKIGSVINSESYSWSNGQQGDTISINSNGEYTCTMKYKANTSPETTTDLSYTVTNIDNEAPTASISCDDNMLWKQSKTIRINNASDMSVGLHETPYRFYNGSSWTDWVSTATYTVNKNGTYEAEVRDALENTSSYNITIDKIDTVSPTASIVYDNITWEQSKTITISNASDAYSGLHETPYRFYNGSSWTEWGTTTSFTVTKNGTYKAEVRDKAENIWEATIPVTRVDETAPTADIIYNNTAWEQSKTITISNASDEGVGLHAMPYRFFDGTRWSSWNTIAAFTVNKNGTYKIEVRDKISNTLQKEITIDKIDTTAPTVVVEYDKSSWETEKNIKIVSAEDLQSGLHETPYRFYNGSSWTEWGNKGEWTIDKNGLFKIEVRDATSNTYAEEISITRVDTEGLNAKVSAYPTTWTKNAVNITVTATAKSGLAQKAYSYDKGATWIENNTLSVINNGTYHVYVKDSNDRIVKKTITIENIDNERPVIEQVSAKDAGNATIEVSIIASDNQSGLADDAYSYDNGNTWTSQSTYVIDNTDRITVQVRDEVGNVSSQTIQYEAPVTNVINEVPTKEEEPLETHIKEIEEDVELMTVTSEPYVLSENGSDTKLVTIKEERLPLKTFAAAATTASGGGAGIILVFFWIFKTAKVYNIMPDKSLRYLGRVRIKRAITGYKVTIPTKMINKSRSSELKVSFPQKFTDKNIGEQLLIQAQSDADVIQNDTVVLDNVKFKIKYTGVKNKI